MMRYALGIAAAAAVAGGALDAAAQVVWNDVSGQGRDSGQLTMADGQCQMYAQEQVNQANAQAPSCARRACAVMGAATVILTRQNAYNNCMRAQGWVRGQAGSVSSSHSTVICRDGTRQDLESGPPFCEGHGGAAGSQ